MTSPESDGRQIEYSDEWKSENFYENTLYNPKRPEFDEYEDIPEPELRAELETQIKKFLRDRNRQRPQKLFFNLLFQLLSGNTPPTESPPTPTEGPDPEQQASVTLGMRTRRPTKYKFKGNCKKPPKKHDKEDIVDEE